MRSPDEEFAAEGWKPPLGRVFTVSVFCFWDNVFDGDGAPWCGSSSDRERCAQVVLETPDEVIRSKIESKLLGSDFARRGIPFDNEIDVVEYLREHRRIWGDPHLSTLAIWTPEPLHIHAMGKVVTERMVASAAREEERARRGEPCAPQRRTASFAALYDL